MIRLIAGNMLRFLVGLLWIACSIPGWIIISLPLLLATLSVRLSCWSEGRHSFDPYRWLMEDNISKVSCQICGKSISEKELPDFLARREKLIESIHTVSQHLQEVSEQNEVQAELNKVV